MKKQVLIGCDNRHSASHASCLTGRLISDKDHTIIHTQNHLHRKLRLSKFRHSEVSRDSAHFHLWLQCRQSQANPGLTIASPNRSTRFPASVRNSKALGIIHHYARGFHKCLLERHRAGNSRWSRASAHKASNALLGHHRHWLVSIATPGYTSLPRPRRYSLFIGRNSELPARVKWLNPNTSRESSI